MKIGNSLLWVVFFGLHGSSWGASLGTSTNINFVFNLNPLTLTTPCFAVGGCFGTAPVPGTTSQMTYSSFGAANYGTLGGFAQGSVTPGVVTSGAIPLFGNIASVGWFVDDFTFTGGSGTGSVRLEFLVGGTITSSGNAFGSDCMNVRLGNNPSGLDCTLTAGAIFPTPGSPYFISQPVSITFGQPTTLTAGLITWGHINDFLSSNVRFTSDFSHTMSVVGFAVTDASGRPITSFGVTSGSGTVYPAVTLPEPDSLWLVFSSVPLLAGLRRLVVKRK